MKSPPREPPILLSPLKTRSRARQESLVETPVSKPSRLGTDTRIAKTSQLASETAKSRRLRTPRLRSTSGTPQTEVVIQPTTESEISTQKRGRGRKQLEVAKESIRYTPLRRAKTPSATTMTSTASAKSTKRGLRSHSRSSSESIGSVDLGEVTVAASTENLGSVRRTREMEAVTPARRSERLLSREV